MTTNININQSFESLNLNELLLKGVYLYGFTKPSNIQKKGIISINTKKDCIIQSQSGTGKTATYLLGVLNLIECNDNNCQGIIITPTRELSNQVYDVAINLSKFTDYKITKCIGGTNIMENKNELKNTNIIIGTLGRIYHIISEKFNINKLKFIVIDEIDDLLYNGIDDKIKLLLEKLPKGIQIIVISATMSLNVFNFSKTYMYDPIKILLKNNEVIIDLISQFYLDVEIEDQKFDTLLDLYNLISMSQTIIFCNTIKKIEWLDTNLKENNFPITIINSNMTTPERNKILEDFRNGNTRILLTTDLLSRGIDIPQVNMVINYDLPINKETYVHRIGRCGRFDKKGIAISLVKKSDINDMKILNKLIYFYKININEMPESLDNYI
jgi:superfamily II DNA/RNA helicase